MHISGSNPSLSTRKSIRPGIRRVLGANEGELMT
jgi:hypothetical protein